MTHPSMPPEQQKTQGMIRMSMLLGVLLFGLVVYFLHHRPDYVSPGENPPLRMALAGVMLMAIVGIGFARFKLDRARTPGEASTFQVIGWAAGEAVGLAGGVYYMLTDNPMLFVTGLFVQLSAFLLIPLRR